PRSSQLHHPSHRQLNTTIIATTNLFTRFFNRRSKPGYKRLTPKDFDIDTNEPGMEKHYCIGRCNEKLRKAIVEAVAEKALETSGEERTDKRGDIYVEYEVRQLIMIRGSFWMNVCGAKLHYE
ncbi:hypothetical protein P5770_28265, partial [Bacillus cereus]|nr:hypothetical protein [Bacillus cereus]